MPPLPISDGIQFEAVAACRGGPGVNAPGPVQLAHFEGEVHECFQQH